MVKNKLSKEDKIFLEDFDFNKKQILLKMGGNFLLLILFMIITSEFYGRDWWNIFFSTITMFFVISTIWYMVSFDLHFERRKDLKDNKTSDKIQKQINHKNNNKNYKKNVIIIKILDKNEKSPENKSKRYKEVMGWKTIEIQKYFNNEFKKISKNPEDKKKFENTKITIKQLNKLIENYFGGVER